MLSWPVTPEVPTEHSSEDLANWYLPEIILRPPNTDCPQSRQTLIDYIDHPPVDDVPDDVWLAIFHARTCAAPECRQLYLTACEV